MKVKNLSMTIKCPYKLKASIGIMLLGGLFGCSSESEPKKEIGLVIPSQEGTTQTEQVTPEAKTSQKLVVYSSRKEHLIKPLFDLYTQNTGIEIEYLTDKAAPLLARLEAEGQSSPADVLITVDAGNLWQAAERNLLAKVSSSKLEASVPAHLRDPQGRWFGLSIRARTVIYSKERVKPENLSTYEALADPDWKDRLCLRTSKKVYNQSLVATMMASIGEAQTEQVVKGWVNNLATDVFSNDTAVLEAIAAGQCDVTIVNTYYFGRLQKDQLDIPLQVFWPNQGDRGTHVNISGAGVVATSKQPELAQQLVEWLASEEAQGRFAGLNLEYPVNTKVSSDPLVQAWGDFKQDTINVQVAGERQADAIKLMDRAGYR